MSTLDLDLLVNAGYVGFLLSYLMRDILWLRVLSVAATSCILPYYLLQSQPLWIAFGWNAAFVVINLYWIIRLLYERRPVHFTPEQQRLYEQALRTLRPRYARKLLEGGVWKDIDPGAAIVTEGRPSKELSLVVSGRVAIERAGMAMDEIGEGRFVGCSNYLCGGEERPAVVTYKAVEHCRVVAWRHEHLRTLVANEPELSLGVEASLGLELARYLTHSRAEVEHLWLLKNSGGLEASAH
jgi:hypothetical protein